MANTGTTPIGASFTISPIFLPAADTGAASVNGHPPAYRQAAKSAATKLNPSRSRVSFLGTPVTVSQPMAAR